MEINDEHTKKLVELSEDYCSLYCSMLVYNDLTKSVIKAFSRERIDSEYCITLSNFLSEYFIRLKSLNWEEFIKIISIYNEHVQKCIIERFEIIYRISKKYNINCIDELLDIINDQWNNGHINHDIFKRNIIRVLNEPKTHNFMNKSFNKIFIDMVNDDILDPMQPVGTSNEVLYTMLPNGPEFYEANYKVFLHPIDWQVIRNGCNPLLHFSFSLNEKGDYYYNIITNALKKDCCVFDNIFRNSVFSKPEPWNSTTYDWLVMGLDQEKLSLIKDYLIIPEIFNHQLELYRGHENVYGDENIKELKEYAQQKRIALKNK